MYIYVTEEGDIRIDEVINRGAFVIKPLKEEKEETYKYFYTEKDMYVYAGNSEVKTKIFIDVHENILYMYTDKEYHIELSYEDPKYPEEHTGRLPEAAAVWKETGKALFSVDMLDVYIDSTSSILVIHIPPFTTKMECDGNTFVLQYE